MHVIKSDINLTVNFEVRHKKQTRGDKLHLSLPTQFSGRAKSCRDAICFPAFYIGPSVSRGDPYFPF